MFSKRDRVEVTTGEHRGHTGIVTDVDFLDDEWQPETIIYITLDNGEEISVYENEAKKEA